jgi:hypothetical protein
MIIDRKKARPILVAGSKIDHKTFEKCFKKYASELDRRGKA